MRRFILLMGLFVFVACSSSDSGGGNPSGDATSSDVSADGTDNADGDSLLDGSTDGEETSDDVTTSDPETTSPDAGDDTGQTEAPMIQIKLPNDDDLVTETIVVQIVPVKEDELLLESLTVRANGLQIFSDTKAPTQFLLDTRTIDADELVLEAVALRFGDVAEDSLTVDVTNTEQQFDLVASDRKEYQSGDTVTVSVRLSHPDADLEVDFGDMDTGYVPGSENIFPVGDTEFVVVYTITGTNLKGDGLYEVPVRATWGDTVIQYSDLHLSLETSQTLPLRVQRAIFVPGLVPPESGGWIGSIGPSIEGSSVVVTGGSASISVGFTNYVIPENIVGILIWVDGYTGYYQLPLEDSAGTEETLLTMRTYAESENVPSELLLRAALRDAQGRISPSTYHTMEVKPVGSGDIQVSVQWDTDTDLDLHVIEPGGCELYYGNKTGCAGFLDLDSNPACFIDGINNENVYWELGAAPLGDYQVKVDFYSDCGSQGANYTVTLQYCGKTEVFEDSFAPDTDDHGGAGSGVLVAEFNNENCTKALTGVVRYEDRLLKDDGFSARTWKPVRYARLELRRVENDEVLAVTSTDRFGNYMLNFSNQDGPEGVYLAIISQSDLEEGIRDISVRNHPKFGQLYEIHSPELNDSNGENFRQDIDITEADKAGAFNIYDVLVEGYDRIRLATGRELGPLNAYWATGADTTETAFCSEYLYSLGVCSEQDALSVQGKDSDRDEYDDRVIMREFFKFTLDQVSRENSPGGVSDGTRGNPARAWTEGVSTFFSCDASNTQVYIDSRPLGVYVFHDLEAMESPFSYRTDNDAMTGPVSEYLIFGLLWDIADGISAGEAQDNMNHMSTGIYDVIFNHLPGDHFLDRGAEGVDLVDFLDGWLCNDWGQEAAMSGLLNERIFPYDFAPGNCGN
ncbi:MAG: hypothetical protein CMH54_10850 [Myxococcales bacterium]|nr:hypothetical protein [Myxococcales bacterium]